MNDTNKKIEDDFFKSTKKSTKKPITKAKKFLKHENTNSKVNQIKKI